jgi:hypothetical protein
MTAPYHHLGPDAEREWAEHLAKVAADAEAMRHPIEEVPE